MSLQFVKVNERNIDHEVHGGTEIKRGERKGGEVLSCGSVQLRDARADLSLFLLRASVCPW